MCVCIFKIIDTIKHNSWKEIGFINFKKGGYIVYKRNLYNFLIIIGGEPLRKIEENKTTDSASINILIYDFKNNMKFLFYQILTFFFWG